MAIFRCNKCALLQEQADSLIGQNYACPNCGNLAPVYNAMFFIEKLLDKYFQAQREVIRLKSPAQKEGATPKLSTSPAAPADFDVFNTDHLASEVQHGPIVDWFGRKQIKVQANMRGVDTTGFFDEVAMGIGQNLPVLKEVLEKLRWAQQWNSGFAPWPVPRPETWPTRWLPMRRRRGT